MHELVAAGIGSTIGKTVSSKTIQRHVLTVVGVGDVADAGLLHGREVVDEVIGVDELEVVPRGEVLIVVGRTEDGCDRLLILDNFDKADRVVHLHGGNQAVAEEVFGAVIRVLH